MSLDYSRPTLNLQRCARNSAIGVCEQQSCRPACASVQSDQRLSYSLIKKYHFKLASSEISLYYLVSVAEKAGFGVILWQTLKTDFVASMLFYIHVNADSDPELQCLLKV